MGKGERGGEREGKGVHEEGCEREVHGGGCKEGRKRTEMKMEWKCNTGVRNGERGRGKGKREGKGEGWGENEVHGGGGCARKEERELK